MPPKNSQSTTSTKVVASTKTVDSTSAPKKTKKSLASEPVAEPVTQTVEESVEESVDASETNVSTSTKEVNITNYLELLNSTIDLLTANIDLRSKKGEAGINSLKKIHKNLVLLRNRAPKLVPKSKRPKKESNDSSGFRNKIAISRELADFLKVTPDTRLATSDITRAICVYIHYDALKANEQSKGWAHLNPKGARNLQQKSSEKSKSFNTRIAPDAALSKLLNYSKYQKDVKAGLLKNSKGEVITDDGLFYHTIQKLIQPHILREPKVPKTPKVSATSAPVDELVVEDADDQVVLEENQEQLEDTESTPAPVAAPKATKVVAKKATATVPKKGAKAK